MILRVYLYALISRYTKGSDWVIICSNTSMTKMIVTYDIVLFFQTLCNPLSDKCTSLLLRRLCNSEQVNIRCVKYSQTSESEQLYAHYIYICPTLLKCLWNFEEVKFDQLHFKRMDMIRLSPDFRRSFAFVFKSIKNENH
mgnify:CR=1 FL=1